MADLHDFIATRRLQLIDLLEAKRAENRSLVQEIARLERELSDLDHASRAIGLVNRLPALTINRRLPAVPTIKKAVLDVLENYPSGLSALQILAEINERYGTDYPRTSLSPQLSRLKQEEKLSKNGTLWVPAKKREKK